VQQDPLLLAGQQTHFHQHLHATVPRTGLADDWAQFLIAPLQLERVSVTPAIDTMAKSD
jgi:hypothetical protein